MHVQKTLEQKIEECLALLRSTNRDKIENLINQITSLGYFEAPGSLNHHRFKGGLVSHSLETYHKALQLRDKKILEGFDPSEMPDDSIIIAALMHDLCKADALRYTQTIHRTIELKQTDHSARSVRLIEKSEFQITPAEKEAILWHMGGKKKEKDLQKRLAYFKSHPLSDIIYWADKKSIGESKRRHHPEKYK